MAAVCVGLAAAEPEGNGAARFELRRVAEGAGTNTEIIPWAKARPGGDTELRVEKGSLLDGRHIEKVEVEKDPINGNDQLKITLTKEGAELFAKVTKESIGKQIAVVVKGKVAMAPVVREEISGRSLMISGNFTAAEVKELSELLSPRKQPESRSE